MITLSFYAIAGSFGGFACVLFRIRVGFRKFWILASVEIGLGFAMLYLLVPYISVFMQVFRLRKTVL
jgi:hypothetical protein